MTDVSLRHEPMAPFFDKFHLEGLPCAAVLHRFADVDTGPPHDHPWDFTSHIISGGYAEEIYGIDQGLISTVWRHPGDCFMVPSGRIHRIIRLLEAECWTLIRPLGGGARKSGFYEWREDGAYHRFWDEPEFKRLEVTA